MRPGLSWIALGLGAYIGFLTVTFPAGTAAAWFAPASVALVAPAGTLWRGSAAAASLDTLTVTDLRWRLNAWTLLAGRLGGTLEFRLPDGFARSDFTATPAGDVVLRDLQFSASIQGLAHVVPVYDTRGQISAQLELLAIENGRPVSAIGEVRVGQLQVAPLIANGSASRIELGGYRAELTGGSDAEIVARVTSVDGPLELDGNLTVRDGRNYLFDGQVRPLEDASDELRQGIEIMAGTPDAAGRRQISFSGSL